eukprot:5588778-Amphidinium_carterae.1
MVCCTGRFPHHVSTKLLPPNADEKTSLLCCQGVHAPVILERAAHHASSSAATPGNTCISCTMTAQ